MRILSIITVITLFISACHQTDVFEENTPKQKWFAQIPKNVNIPPVLKNGIEVDKMDLGKKLFFDTRLSEDNSVACVSCHNPSFAFSDQKELAVGVYGRVGERNSPALFNLAWFNSFFHDGGAQTLEAQIISSIENEKEMNMPISKLIHRLKQDSSYSNSFWDVYGRELNTIDLLDAIASYQFSLVSFNSDFDTKKNQTYDRLKGYELFMSDRLNCAACHTPPLFMKNDFAFNASSKYSEDRGRYMMTFDSTDIGFFKIPSIRNIGFTGPYFHNGSLKSIEAVIEHYENLKPNDLSKDQRLRDFELNDIEKKQLLAFLLSLNDSTFVQ